MTQTPQCPTDPASTQGSPDVGRHPPANREASPPFQMSPYPVDLPQEGLNPSRPSPQLPGAASCPRMRTIARKVLPASACASRAIATVSATSALMWTHYCPRSPRSDSLHPRQSFGALTHSARLHVPVAIFHAQRRPRRGAVEEGHPRGRQEGHSGLHAKQGLAPDDLGHLRETPLTGA